jgi:hypothetical protein
MMLDNFPGSFTLVQIHLADNYTTTWGNSRRDFYGVMLTPWALFDGVEECIGELSDVNQQYNWYLEKYLIRRAVPTDLVIGLTGYPLSPQTYRVVARVCVEPGGTAKTMRVYMVEVLDYWPKYSQYFSRNGFKQAAATKDIILGPGECQTIVRNFAFDDESWLQQDDIKIIAWVQEPQDSGLPPDRAEVFQAATMAWPFPPDCNANGIPDDQDIGSGASPDANGNGIPDECEFVFAGLHLWTTPPGGTTYQDFASEPIPPGFFGPGSDPFDGLIVLKGQPVPTDPPEGLGPADTVVQRLEDAYVPQPQTQDTVEIEIRALNLVGIEPITVTFSGQDAELWEVRACLSELPQPTGSMIIERTCSDGGTYQAALPVLPRFIFTRLSDQQQRVLDFGVAGRPPLDFASVRGKWVYQADPRLKVISTPAGVRVDASCTGSLGPPLPGSTNFVPGIWALHCEAAWPGGEGQQRKRLMPYLAPTAAHGVIAAQIPGPDSDGDGIPDDADNCSEDFNPLQEDTDWDSIGDVCDNCPQVYNLLQEDRDSDGWGDPCDNCPYHFNPGQEDSDGDGTGDACEFAPGDLNCDGEVNFGDINPFVLALSNPAAYQNMYPGCILTGDINGDGLVNFGDINPFVALLLGF